MILVIPTNNKKGLEDKIADHFGRCATYTFINEKGEVIEIIDNISKHMGGSDLPPELIKKYKVNVLLCKEIGPRAINLCKQLGINVYILQVDTVKDIFILWQKNKLKKASIEDSCKQHKKDI